MIKGNDVSHHNRRIDWNRAKSQGIKFSFIRSNFGYNEDREFNRNWAGAKAAGIPRGAYGWPLHGMNQEEIARRFVNRWIHDPGEIKPVADFESTKYHGNTTFEELKRFLNEVERLSGIRPIIYTSQGYWNGRPNHTNQLWALNYELWVANYTLASQPRMPSVWANDGVPYTFWQYTSKADCRAYGGDSTYMDLNWFNGDSAAFNKYIKGGTVQPPVMEDVLILVDQLWGRSEPVFESRTHSVIVRKGELYDKAGEKVFEAASGITWQPIKVPERIVYVSADKKYIKEQ